MFYTLAGIGTAIGIYEAIHGDYLFTSLFGSVAAFNYVTGTFCLKIDDK